MEDNNFEIKYCKRCLLPNTRPGINIGDDGVSNVWKESITKNYNIDWDKREDQFKTLVSQIKKKEKEYDCIVPVSGGKDSTWQILKCIEYGLNVLAVTWKTPARTKIGQSNLDNLISLGVDHIDFTINPDVEKKFMYKSFVKFGTTALPMHMALFNIPLKIAVKFDIPLVIWGENSAVEYGTDDESLMSFEMNSKWLKKHGVMHGTTAKDWIGKDLTKKDLTPYFGPNDKELNKAGVNAIFLGHFFKWDPERSLKIAKENGFKVRVEGPKTGYYNYADIDCDFISIHHFIKWYKFGFTRLFDNLAIELKKGRITIDEAKKIIKDYGIQEPKNDINKLCDFLGIEKSHFYNILESFRNHKIWIQENKKWKIKNFPISDWKW